MAEEGKEVRDVMAMTVPLTPRQLKFVDAYMATLSQKEACAAAGYNRESASNVLKRCKKEILRRMAEVRTTSIANAQEVLEFFTKVMRGGITQQVLMVINGKVQVHEVDARVADRIKAAECLAKHYNLFVEAAKITEQPMLQDDIPIDMSKCEVIYDAEPS